jgi:hypothetical protein
MPSPVVVGCGVFVGVTTRTVTLELPDEDWFIQSLLGLLDLGTDPTTWDSDNESERAAAAAAMLTVIQTAQGV